MSFQAFLNASMSGLFTLLGVVIAVVANIVIKRGDQKYAIKLKRLEVGMELEKRYLLEPLVSFIDKELQLMQRVFAEGPNAKEPADYSDFTSRHYLELSVTEARVKALGDEALIGRFNAFSIAKIGIGTSVYQHDLAKAESQLKSAIALAGEILGLLFRKLRKIEE